MTNIIKKCISANIILAITLFSVIAPSDICNATTEKVLFNAKFNLGKEGTVSKKFRSSKELNRFFDNHMKQTEAVQMNLGCLDELDSENVKESIDNGCIIYLNTDSYKKLEHSNFIRKIVQIFCLQNMKELM